MWMAEGAIHFKEDVLRIKRRRCRSVIPSLLSGQALSASFGSLAGQRSFAALRMTNRDGLFFEMYCGLGVISGYSLTILAFPSGNPIVCNRHATQIQRAAFPLPLTLS